MPSSSIRSSARDEDFSRATFWQNPGDKTEYPSLEFADDGYTGQFDGDIDTNIERVSYLRLKQLSLSYSLPETWTKRLRMKDVRIYSLVRTSSS